MGPVRTRALCAFLLVCLATFVSANDGKTTKAPKDCPVPQCASKDCRTKVGADGCLECDCRPADCPLLVCGPGCHEETNATAHRCPECVCNGAGQDRPCPELTCPPECEKETVKPAHRCPWCLCPAITAKLTLLNYGERHCPHALLDMVFRQADPLAQHVHHLQEQVRHQDGAVQHLVASGGGAGERPPPADCVPPKCDGKGCQLVPGDQGCPRCVCTPEPTPKKKGNKTKTGKAVTKRHTGAKKESSEESNESDSKESKETTRGSRTRRDDQKTTGRRDSRKQDKQTNQTAAAAANRTEAAHPRQLPPPPPVQCVTPVCEPYCKYRQAEHGCLVCECPDVCPEMVCGTGCQPYFTEASKCQKCLCAPHSRREELAEVFAGFCKEHTLHRMVADFDDFRDILLRLQHRSLELQELIGRAEHARGIHGPVPEEIRASFGRHHHSHHPPLHHQAAHHPKHGHHQHAKPAERHQN